MISSMPGQLRHPAAAALVHVGVDSGIDSTGSSPEMMLTSSQTSPPMSRTHQYRKVMKPLLERKRRARINRCLDELKDIMVGALQAEGESITKLEKADVLELTVRHLRKLKQQNALGLTPEATYASRFKAGYAHCAQEVSRFMSKEGPSLGLDLHVSTRLITHLGGCLQSLERVPPSALASGPLQPSPVLLRYPPGSPSLSSSSSSQRGQAQADEKPPAGAGSKSPGHEEAWRPW